MTTQIEPERVETVVIGGGQAGLAVGYHLSRLGLPFVILDADARVGDAWRRRWDSLRLFTPARYNSLAGMPFPAPPRSFVTKDEMADYLEAYAARFSLPVRSGVRVERISRSGDGYLVEAAGRRLLAAHVVVAMSNYQKPRVPEFAGELDGTIVQLHSSAYRNPSQLKAGGVLLVGAGNSGAEIAREVSRDHATYLSGPSVGHVPFRIEGALGGAVLQPLVLSVVFHRLLTVDTALGRKARPSVVTKGAPLIRVKPKDLEAAGVRSVPRVAGARDGLPLLADGTVLDVANVVWCTGFHAGFSWIDLPIALDAQREPVHERGVVPGEPGLYFVGLHFLYAMSSSMVQGVSRDAEHVVSAIAARVRASDGARRVGEPRLMQLKRIEA